MREVVLDTETTGLFPKEGHKIVEIACIETKDLIVTKKIFMNMIQNHSKRNGISIISSHEVNDYSLNENVIIIDLNKI